jgi:phosphoglycolate phosphatase-like HAD superfamily hydrolase
MSRPSGVLFDLDGTLCDPRVGLLEGFRVAFAGIGLPYPGDRAASAQIGRPLLECFQALGCQERSAQGALLFKEHFERIGRAEAVLYEGVTESLGALKADGLDLAIASSKPAFAVRFVVEALGISGIFDGLYGCADEDLRPDKNRIVAEALKGLGWEPRATVLVGDRSQDRDAAAAHGLVFIAAAWGFGAPEEHLGAAAVARHPRELAALCVRSYGAACVTRN